MIMMDYFYSEVLLNAKGKDGLFFLRDRTNHPGDYVMCVQFKGKATHHLLRKNEAGFWIINNKQYGKCSTLSEVSQRNFHIIDFVFSVKIHFFSCFMFRFYFDLIFIIAHDDLVAFRLLIFCLSHTKHGQSFCMISSQMKPKRSGANWVQQKN